MIIIRADGNEILGSGHIMRCLSLADALKENQEVVFVISDSYPKNLIEERGYKAYILGTDFKNMLDEIPVFFRLINELSPECIIIDSYYVAEEYLSKIKESTSIVYIDDQELFAYPSDIIINYNIYADKDCYDKLYDDAQADKPIYILGSQYALLREQFMHLPRFKVNQSVNDILVSAGGTDPERINQKIIRNICGRYKNTRFHFVVGSMNPWKDEIFSLQKSNENAIVHQNVTDMSRLMMSCDMAISAAGTTLYELCACGIPTITYTLADNQILAAKEFNKRGMMISVGDCRNDDSFMDRLNCKIIELIDDVELRIKMSEVMQNQVDGKGSERIAEYICRKV